MEFKVRTNNLNNAASSIFGVEAALLRASLTVGEVSRVLRNDSHDYDMIARKLSGYQTSLAGEATAVRRVRTTLGTITQQYSMTERQLMLLRPNKRGVSMMDILKRAFENAHTGFHGWPGILPINIGPIPIRGPVIGISPAVIAAEMLKHPGYTNTGDMYKNPYEDLWKHALDGMSAEGHAGGPEGSTYADAGLDPDNLGAYAGAGAAGTLFTAGGAFGIGNLFNAEGEVAIGKGSADASAEAGLMKDGEFDPHADIHAGVEVTGIDAHGKVNILGIDNIEAEGKIGHAEAKGDVHVSLFDKDGNISPSLEAKAKAEATLAEGKVSRTIGGKNSNLHVEAEGKVMTASAEAKATITSDGVEVKAGAEAYAAKGSVKGGINILGVQIDAKLTGAAGGAGATAGGKVTGTSASGKLGAGLGVGGEVELSVDWSNNVITQKYNEYKKGFENTLKGLLRH